MSANTIENTYEGIQQICEKKLLRSYPHGVPVPVQERLSDELAYLKTSPALDDFLLFYRLSETACRGGYPIGLRGTISGSILVYLLGDDQLNPLPAHYHCPDCGYFEMMNYVQCGYDLPAKSCPHCGKLLQRDGFRLPLESVWGNGDDVPSFEYNIPAEFFPFAEGIVSQHYAGRTVLPLGMMNGDAHCKKLLQGGVCILPEGFTLDCCGDLLGVLPDGRDCLRPQLDGIRALGIQRILFNNTDLQSALLALQRKTGRFYADFDTQELSQISWKDIRNTGFWGEWEAKIYQGAQPGISADLINLWASAHNSFAGVSWDDTNQHQAILALSQTPEFQKYPCYTREDFWEQLLSCGMEHSLAVEATKFIGKGKASSSKPKELEQLAKYQLPQELEMVAKRYSYVFPRSHSTWYVRQLLRLAAYLNTDRSAYSQVVFSV